MRKMLALFVAGALTASLMTAGVPAAASDSEPDGGITGFFENAADYVSDKAAEAGSAAKGALDKAGQKAGELKKTIADKAGKAVTAAGDTVGEWRDQLSAVAEKVAGAASSASKSVADKSAELAEQAVGTFQGAANVVVDETGNLVNRAKEGADKAASHVKEALAIISEKGQALVERADEIVMELDLASPENVEKAHSAVLTAVDNAYDAGLIDKSVSRETARIVTDIVFRTAVYGYQYAHGMITMSEYVALMSVTIIRSGLPAGVGYIAGKLPIPGAENIAKEATEYLIRAAYGEGEEEVLTEDMEGENEAEAPAGGTEGESEAEAPAGDTEE